MKSKVIISACLLGEICRYDGKIKKNDTIIDRFKEYEIIPFCPEAPLFGTPRQRINIVVIDGENRIITDETDEDVTQKLEDEINRFIDANPHANKIVLKSKSPSCGLGTTPVLNQAKKVVASGDGIGADIFLKRFPDANIMDENSYEI